MYTGSMSEIARGNEQQQNNVSEIAFDGNKTELERQNLPEVQSQVLQRQQKEGKPLQYKKQLLRLMVEVRLEDMGYTKKDIGRLASHENFFPQDLEEVQLNQLTQLANQLVIYFVAEGSSQPSMGFLRFNRIERSRRSAGSQRMPYERQINHQNAQTSNRRERQMTFGHQSLKINPQPIKPFRQILCSICYTLTSQFSQQLCNHSFCNDCFRGFIQQNISSGTFNINCPQYRCQQSISLENIRRLIGDKQYQRYIYFKQKNQKQLNPNNRFCSNPDCGQVLTKIQKGLQCSKCRTQFCDICLQKLHQGSNCDQAIKNAIDQTFSTFKIKKCPNCKSPIQKSQGCNHMNCKKCKHQFCWVCLKPYSQYHYKYYNCFGCPGMQFQNQQDLAYERSKQIMFYLGLPVILAIILLCYLAIIPIYMLGCFVYKPCEWVQNNHRAIERDMTQMCCSCLPECMQIVLLWLLFIFRSLLYATFIAPVKITGIVCGGLFRAFFQ